MKKLISFIMSLIIITSMFTSFAVTINAEDSNETEYIESFQLGVSSDKEKAKDNARKDGYTLVKGYNLNNGTNGDYIYLAYKATTDPNKAIRDLILLETTNDFKHKSNGCTYTVIGGYNDDGKIDAVNINEKVNGNCIYLFYCKDARSGNPISDPIISDDTNKNYGRNQYLIDQNGSYADLNYDRKDEFRFPSIYLFYNQYNYYYDLRISVGNGFDYTKEYATKDNYRLVSNNFISSYANIADALLSYQATGLTDCIRDIVILEADACENEWINPYNNCCYYPIGGYCDFNAMRIYLNGWYSKVELTIGDLNKKEYCFMYTRDPKAGEPLTSLDISEKITDGYKATQYIDQNDINNCRQMNLHEEFENDALYLIFKNENYNYDTGSIFVDKTYFKALITSGAVIIIGVITGIVLTKKKKVTVQ